MDFVPFFFTTFYFGDIKHKMSSLLQSKITKQTEVLLKTNLVIIIMKHILIKLLVQ